MELSREEANALKKVLARKKLSPKDVLAIRRARRKLSTTNTGDRVAIARNAVRLGLVPFDDPRLHPEEKP